MAGKQPTHRVVHPKMYLAFGGKLQHIPEGTEVTLTKEQAEALGNKVVSLADAKKIDLTQEKTEKS